MSLTDFGSFILNNYKIQENGGLISQLIDEFNIISYPINFGKLGNINKWQKVASESFLNATIYQPLVKNDKFYFKNKVPFDNTPYRYMAISLLVWLCFLFLIFLIVLIIGCYVYTKYSKKTSYQSAEKFPSKKTVLSNSQIILRIFLIISFIVWVVSLFLVCISLGSSSSFINPNKNSSNTNSTKSFSVTFTNILTNFQQFGYTLIVETENKIGISVKQIISSLNRQIDMSLREFSVIILREFLVTNVFKTAAKLTDNLTTLLANMKYIKDNYKQLFSEINQVKGEMNVRNSDIKESLQNVCSSIYRQQLSSSLWKRCERLNEQTNQMQTLINTSAINTDSSVVMFFVVEQYALNITNITLAFNNINTSLHAKLDPEFNKIIAKLDISKFFNVIPFMFRNITTSFENVFSFTTINNAQQSVNSINQTIYLALTITSVCVLAIVFISMGFYIFFQTCNYKNHRMTCARFVFLPVFLSICTVILTVLGIILILIPFFIQREFCYQINTTKTQNLLDQKINEKLIDTWPLIINDLDFNVEGSKIIITQPQNVVTGLIHRCRNSSSGIFNVMEIKDFINVTELIKSNQITGTVNSMLNASFNAFQRSSNLESIVPSNTIGFINDSLLLINYFDKINYASSIEQLEKPLMGITDFEVFISSFEMFIVDYKKSFPSSSDLVQLEKSIGQIRTNLPRYSLLANQTKTLLRNFISLQENRDNSGSIRLLLTQLNQLETLLKDQVKIYSIYSRIYRQEIQIQMLDKVDFLISTALERLTSTMIPCNSLSLIIDDIMEMICARQSFNPVFLTFGVLIMMWIILSVCLVICVLAKSIMDRYAMFSINRK